MTKLRNWFLNLMADLDYMMVTGRSAPKVDAKSKAQPNREAA